MRRVTRPALPTKAQGYLDKRQLAANTRHALGTLDIEREWETARQTKAVGMALKTLQQRMGERERCLYCVDSQGSDIEHSRPNAL